MKVYLNGSICIILVVTAFLVFGLIGQEDYKIEAAEHENYISMVCSEAWQDYKNLSPNCE